MSPNRSHAPRPAGPLAAFVATAALLVSALPLTGAESAAVARSHAAYDRDVLPTLKTFCYDCHADGVSKGQVSFDSFTNHTELASQRGLWLSVLKNLQAGLMPPEKKPKPTEAQVQAIEGWINRDVFGIDPEHPDPGRVTVRRLNRIEYRNTIRDLTGFNFKVEDELPPDDTGYGFDNIGDVLTLSPMLLEKYIQAAEKIVTAAVPRVSRAPAESAYTGSDFARTEGKGTGDRLSFYQAATVARSFEAPYDGSYRFLFDLEVLGQFDFDPGRCRVVLKADDREIWQQEFGWQNGKKFSFDVPQQWTAGSRRLAFELQPLVPVEKKINSIDLRIASVRVRGPMEKARWVRPKNFELFFSRDVPEAEPERRAYAREVLKRFARRACRRPVDDRYVDRLTDIATTAAARPGMRFEDGVAQALVPLLASPRFLFRIEPAAAAAATAPATAADDRFPLIDEHALAARLSYFLWATTPDAELSALADRGELRRNLNAQVKRLLADKRSEALVENFVGQWLQVRDVEGIDINARIVLARDRGDDREAERRGKRFQELITIPEEKRTDAEKAEIQQMRDRFRAEAKNRQNLELDGELRRALRDETYMAFSHLMREDRDLIELLDADYTFLNERLAKHYGITNITGAQMRKVSLPAGNPRGGVLTHGSTLIVTSNPTRTSPVKRGLFILDNILGTPAPPAPGNVPALEQAEAEFKDHAPTLRELLQIHREKPLCASCHNRMDPLGLALENFNALGMWRDSERGQAIDAAGKLVTGESFTDIRELKRSLAARHRTDFYRCVTEKLLTYALGRGLEYYDVATVERIVRRLESGQGRFAELLAGIVESAPFQRTRRGPGDRAGN